MKFTFAPNNSQFTPYDVNSACVTSPPTHRPNMGVYNLADNTFASDQIGSPHWLFTLTWPVLTLTETNALITMLDSPPPWHMYYNKVWDGVDPGASPPQYWIVTRAPGSLDTPFAPKNTGPAPGVTGDTAGVHVSLTLTLVETGRGVG